MPKRLTQPNQSKLKVIARGALLVVFGAVIFFLVQFLYMKAAEVTVTAIRVVKPAKLRDIEVNGKYLTASVKYKKLERLRNTRDLLRIQAGMLPIVYENIAYQGCRLSEFNRQDLINLIKLLKAQLDHTPSTRGRKFARYIVPPESR